MTHRPAAAHRISLLVAVLLLPACADADADGTAGPAVTVRDSAGVAIVENPDPAAAPEWTVRRTLEIGSLDAEGPEALFRVVAARTLPGGGVAVLNNGSGEVRLFDASGAFVRSLGRLGEGPGELADPRGLWPLAGDSILVWDREQRRLTAFGLDGGVGSIDRLDADISNPDVVTVFDDGSLLVSDELFAFPDGGFAPVRFTLTRFARDGTALDSLPGGVRAEMGVWDLGGGSIRVGPRLFAGFTTVAGDGRGWWVGTGHHEEVVRYDASGAVARIARWPAVDRTVRPADVEANLRAALERAPDSDPELLRRQHAAREVAEAFPAYEQVVASAGGGAWVRPYSRPGAEGDPTWTVLDPEGRLVGRVRLPQRFRPMEIGPDHLLGIERDELDVERLVRFEIVRDAAAAGDGG